MNAGAPCSKLIFTTRRSTSRMPEASDAEVRAILVSAMADVGADPAVIYAFQKTGVYVCEENGLRLSKRKLAAWSGAVDEYHNALARRRQ